MPFPIELSVAFLTLLLATPLPALAINDWSVPCTQGKCSWDPPADFADSGASRSMQIWGSVNAISDITPAAGWQLITTCNPTSSNQVIQLVCEDNNPSCNQLFQGNGAMNTVVRMPESCGPNPFARVAQHQVLQSNLFTLDNGLEVPVHQLTLDTDFAAIVPSEGNEVYFALQGQNGKNDLNTVNRRNHWMLRPLARQSLNDSIVDLVWSGQGNLCRNGSSFIGIDAYIQASINISVVAAGTISPPKITEFEITIGLDGNTNATFIVSGNISGQASSPNIPLYRSNRTGIPGLNFPPILDIGPEFTLFSRVVGNIGLENVSAAVGVNHNFGGASFVFPPGKVRSKSGIKSNSGQVKFSANPGPNVLGLTIHLIPQVNLRLNALFNATSTSVYLYFDTSLGLHGNVSSGNKPQSCLSGNAGINAEMGTQGSFFNKFRNSTGRSTFKKNFTLFQRCFDGNSSSSNFILPNFSYPNSSSLDSSPPCKPPDPAPESRLHTFFKLLLRCLRYAARIWDL